MSKGEIFVISSRNAKNPPRRRPSHLLISFSTLAVFLTGLIAWLLMHPSISAPEEQSNNRHKRIQQVKPAPAVKQATEKQAVPMPKFDEHEGMIKSSLGVWQPTNRPWRADRRRVHAVHTNGANRVRQPLPYNNATEQLLLQTFGREVGLAPFPLLKLPKKDMDNLVGILMSDNPVTDKDTEDIVISKEIIAEAKAEMRKFIKDGGNPCEFFEYYHNVLRHAYEKRKMAQKEILRIAREEKDLDLARLLQKEVNNRLVEDGIKPLKLDLPDDFE